MIKISKQGRILPICYFIFLLHQISKQSVFKITSPEKENLVQKRQNLEIDSCVDKATNFCNSKVENSICNFEKNECFCKRGFVVIRERNKVICKPLLTDLPCRIDRDCVHVSGSMCHPGAAQCVCPSRHVFVPQLFLCRKKYELASADTGFCKLCRENNGECFLYDPKDTRIFGYKPRETVGCSCGGNRALIAIESPTTLNICSAKLVDIGQICNDKDLICISLKAVCAKTIDRCQCIEGYVPVYQTMLQYYECFPAFDERNLPQSCIKCHSSSGKCYDSTNSNKPDGCICSGSHSNVENGPASLNNPCSINHLITEIQDDKIKLCFQPYSFPPFETLKFQLRANRAALFVSHPHYNGIHLSNNRKKLQTHLQNINDKIYFCGLVDTNEKNFIIKAKQIQVNKIQYEGTLEIVRDSLKHDSIIDMSFAFKVEKEGNLLDRINVLHENNNSKTHETLQLELRVLDATKSREIIKMGLINPFLLDITLIDSTGFYTDLLIENCFFSNFSSYNVSNTLLYSSFIYQRCSNDTKPVYIIWKQISPGIHYQTTPIFLNQAYSWPGEVYIHCQISLCSNQQSCQSKECNQKVFDDPQSRSLYRYTKILLLEKAEESLENVYGMKENNCPYSLCLNQLQAVMTSVLLILLLLLVIILLLILFKRQRMLQKFSIAKLNLPSTVNSYKTSSDFLNVTNSSDNIEISETTLPIQDNSLTNTFHLRTEPYERVRSQYIYPHYHRPMPYYDSNQVMITSCQTIPCSNIKVPDINLTHKSVESSGDHSELSDNLNKINNLELTQKSTNKNLNIHCSEMICMCNE